MCHLFEHIEDCFNDDTIVRLFYSGIDIFPWVDNFIKHPLERIQSVIINFQVKQYIKDVVANGIDKRVQRIWDSKYINLKDKYWLIDQVYLYRRRENLVGYVDKNI